MKCALKGLIFLYVVVLYTPTTLAQQENKISTWNMEWLDIKGNRQFKPSLRSNADFYKMSEYFAKIEAPILAFQEVASAAAIQSVVGGEYEIFLSDRSLPSHHALQFSDINQYTGFAVKKGLKVTDPSDFSLLQTKNKLRFASYIILEDWQNEPVHLLSIHLKARCSGQYRSNNACKTLKQQVLGLNAWIKAREEQGEAYIIAGDFNHNLAYPNDWLWHDLSSQSHAVLSTRKVSADCVVRNRNNAKKTHQFRSLIDHIVVSQHFVIDEATQDVFTSSDVLSYQLSDHCPLSITIGSMTP
ncbi:endonuclease/exonuclease/phosphatase family protein [Vibrio renipiscarius]